MGSIYLPEMNTDFQTHRQLFVTGGRKGLNTTTTEFIWLTKQVVFGLAWKKTSLCSSVSYQIPTFSPVFPTRSTYSLIRSLWVHSGSISQQLLCISQLGFCCRERPHPPRSKPSTKLRISSTDDHNEASLPKHPTLESSKTVQYRGHI